MKQQSFFLFIGLIAVASYALYTSTVEASDDLSLTGATSTVAVVGVPLAITDLQIAGSTTSTVPVKLVVSNGTLEMGTTDGLTFTGDETGSTLEFSGSLANVNSALATLTYTRASAGADTLEVSLVEAGEVFFGDNGHLYKFISGTITWTAAESAAELQTAYGVSGYLATITSEDENDFVADRLEGDGWMGASDAASEGDWKWVTGPETGTSFWSGAGGGSAVGGRYENWASGEPNDSGSNEDCAQFYVSNGTWNDLPCNFNLAGYVVEFGSPGDLPAVVARDISITTVVAPTLNTVTPADNATGVALDTNISLTFSEAVTTSSGSVVLRKTSDGSIVETYASSSSRVSGTGTANITIDPSVTLDELTGYYVTIASSTFTSVSTTAAYLGISGSTVWNFTTGDFTAPVITDIATTTASTSSTITWTTDEAASTQVSYGVTSAFTASTTLANTAPRVTAHSATLTSLLPCTTYTYRVESLDASDNTATSSPGTFVTAGCSGDAATSAVTSTAIDDTTGGTTSLTKNSATMGVTTPANISTSTDSVVIQIQSLPRTTVLSSIGMPPSGNAVGSVVFDVKAIINGTTELDSFNAPVTITYTYDDEDIVGLDESTLVLYHYGGGSWSQLNSCSTNQSTNTITCTTESFSIFALFGDELQTGGGGAQRITHLRPPSITKAGASAASGALRINNGDTTTAQAQVTLQLFVDNASLMAISEDPSFTQTSYQPFKESVRTTLTNRLGAHTVYVKLLSRDGASLIVQDSIELLADGATTPPVSEQTPEQLRCVPDAYPTETIIFGGENSANQVRLLEQFLNDHNSAGLVTDGVYGETDVAAVIAWQEKHAAAVLVPWGIQQGTGYVGSTTLAKIAAVAEACNQPAVSQPGPRQQATTTGLCLETASSLFVGISDDTVQVAQQMLAQLGYFTVTATGYFGPITEAAVTAFQADSGIDQVGVVGPVTRAALNAAVCS